MIRFKEYFDYDLFESVRVPRDDIKRDHEHEKELNNALKDKVHHEKTRSFHTPHMKEHGLSVLRFHSTDSDTHHVEYHIHHKTRQAGEDNPHPDNKAMEHVLNIVHHDAKKHMDDGHEVRLHAPQEKLSKHQSKRKVSLTQHYGRYVKRLTKNTDYEGTGPHKTLDMSNKVRNTYIIKKKKNAD